MIRCIIYILVGKRSGRRCTGRPAILPYGNASADVGSVDEIKTQLAKLGVNYLIVDALDGYAGGKATLRMLEEVVTFPVTPLRRWFLPAPTVNIKFMK